MYIKLKGCSSWSIPAICALLVLFILLVTCLSMVINILHTRKINNTLVTEIEIAKEDLLVASDKTQGCGKNLEGKNADMTSNDEHVASLTNDVKTFKEENAKDEEQLNHSTAKLKQAGNKSGQPSNLTELRSEEDFIKIIDPECVDTPEFYGGWENVFSV